MSHELTYLAAFMIGLLGSTHCIGMCGGIVGALTMGLPDADRGSMRRLLPYLLLYNGGRLISYTIAGLIIAIIAVSAGHLVQPGKFPLGGIIGGLFMLALGIYIAGWFQTMAPLEKLGSHFWRLIEPAGRRLLPVNSYPKAFALGFVWGWLPCGLVYSTLAMAATAADLVKTPMLMLAFGLGTLPLLLAMGGLAEKLQRFTRNKWTRYVAGILLILFGLFILFKASSMMLGMGPPMEGHMH
jgi:sulfite exporter TauE/SafE